ncbi:MAG: TIGR04053 family radical SAM/SPASM domain-containing protein [Bryobacteraceae bacterium]
MATTMHGSGPRHGARDYNQTPLNIYWEMTQACALACRHCRAEAMPEPHPNELTTEEGLRFVDQIPGFGEPMPHLILTGGDPLARKDLYEVIDHARGLGIGVSITPAATEALTRDVLVKLKEHGVDGLGLSLDGSTAERHDAIRGVPGTFARTMNAMRWAQELEMPLQVNTLVAEQTAGDVPQIFELLKPYGVARWSLFFLISVGRGKVLAALSPEEGEKLMQWIYDVSQDSPFIVATTEAPSYRRVALQRKREQGQDAEDMKKSRATGAFGIRDGHGIMFVSNTGDICPAGFLPVTAGNVKADGIVDVYRDSPLFRQLHDPKTFDGRCGVCEYHILCGGSRARAYGATGNPLAEDPFCPYEPLVPITRG